MGRTATLQRQISCAMALVNNGDSSSYLPPGDSPGRNTEQPQSSSSKTTPFSISAILSEEVGRKRPLMSTTVEVKEKRPRLSEAGHGTEEEGCVSPVGSGGPSISLSHAGSLVLSPQQTSPPGLQDRSPPVSMVPGCVVAASTPAHVLHAFTPQGSINNSLSSSPFNASVLSALGHQQTPGPQEDVLTDSLGILSTVALYHSELSSLSEGNCSTPVHERIEAMRIASCSEHFTDSQAISSSSSDSMLEKKAGTPYILKRDKRRRKQSSEESSLHTQKTTEDSVTSLNTGFLSPTNKEMPLHHQLAFSPSIFLRRPPEPDCTSTSVLCSLNHSSTASSILMASPSSEGGYTVKASEGVNSSFITSTPIKFEKENVQSSSPKVVGRAPTQLSPGLPQASGWGHHIRDETSSGSDSEMPVKRVRKVPKKSRARTKLSPLLENACSPIAKSHPPQPSSLLATVFVPTPATTSSQLPTPHRASYNSALQQTTVQGHTMLQAPNDLPGRTTYHSATTEPSIQSSVLQTTSTYAPHFYPCTTSHQHLSPFYTHIPLPHNVVAASNSKWVSSPMSAQWDHSGQIQCVPPRFIFAQNQSEGNRSRLTEAINRSLTETPSENPKLPAEWTKYACGQTADQKDLTEKAKSFLQCRPRQLTFDGMN